MTFRDRADAGRRLATALAERFDPERLRAQRPVVLALPRGGVPVGAEVAARLGVPLDIVLVRKLGVPGQPELAMGAIGEDGVVVVNEPVCRSAGVSERDIAAVERRERTELDRRAACYRAVRPRIDLGGRAAIVVDDGLATGSTARAAIDVVRGHGASSVLLAVPVAPPETVIDLAAVADEVVALEQPARMWAIGSWYDDFRQTSDDEVLAALRAGAPADR